MSKNAAFATSQRIRGWKWRNRKGRRDQSARYFDPEFNAKNAWLKYW
jgi:hypothetical protein